MSVPVWVIDTNVLVSAALTAGGKRDQIFREAVDGKVRLAWSVPVLAEYRTVLLRPKFKFSPPVVSSLLAAFDPSNQVAPKPAPALPDPDDQVFLGTALATTDKILITGNSVHFPPEICLPVKVLTPAQAIQALLKS